MEDAQPKSAAEDFDVAPAASKDRLALITAACKEAIALEGLIEEAEGSLSELKAALHKQRSVVIPELMGADVPEITVDGRRVEMKDIVSGSIPKNPEGAGRALDHLRQIGGGDIIKRTVTVEVDRGKDVSDLLDRIRSVGEVPVVAEKVHPQTLAAFAREALANGDPINPDTLGLYVGRIAKIGKEKRK